MARHFFTGGQMPSWDLLPAFDRDLVAARALEGERPRIRADARGLAHAHGCGARPAIDRLLAETYGPAEVRRWRARWRLFFMACAELFAYRDGEEWFVAHYLFAPR